MGDWVSRALPDVCVTQATWVNGALLVVSKAVAGWECVALPRLVTEAGGETGAFPVVGMTEAMWVSRALPVVLMTKAG